MKTEREHLADVLCTSVHAVELDDGSSLSPGESAPEVNIASDHNKALVDDGHLTVTKRHRHTSDQTDAEKQALAEDDAAKAKAAVEEQAAADKAKANGTDKEGGK